MECGVTGSASWAQKETRQECLMIWWCGPEPSEHSQLLKVNAVVTCVSRRACSPSPPKSTGDAWSGETPPPCFKAWLLQHAGEARSQGTQVATGRVRAVSVTESRLPQHLRRWGGLLAGASLCWFPRCTCGFVLTSPLCLELCSLNPSLPLSFLPPEHSPQPSGFLDS